MKVSYKTILIAALIAVILAFIIGKSCSRVDIDGIGEPYEERIAELQTKVEARDDSIFRLKSNIDLTNIRVDSLEGALEETRRSKQAVIRTYERRLADLDTLTITEADSSLTAQYPGPEGSKEILKDLEAGRHHKQMLDSANQEIALLERLRLEDEKVINDQARLIANLEDKVDLVTQQKEEALAMADKYRKELKKTRFQRNLLGVVAGVELILAVILAID